MFIQHLFRLQALDFESNMAKLVHDNVSVDVDLSLVDEATRPMNCYYFVFGELQKEVIDRFFSFSSVVLIFFFFLQQRSHRMILSLFEHD
jgi:hypothetical protein